MMELNIRGVPTFRAPPVDVRFRWKLRTVTTAMIVHDSHTMEDVEDADDLIRDMGRRLGYLDTGYHAIINRDGTEVVTRDWDRIGSHSPGNNMTTIGMCLIGGLSPAGPIDNFSPLQKKALFDRYLACRAIWPGLLFLGHNELTNTHFVTEHTCPALDMDQLREDLAIYERIGVIP